MGKMKTVIYKCSCGGSAKFFDSSHCDDDTQKYDVYIMCERCKKRTNDCRSVWVAEEAWEKGREA